MQYKACSARMPACTVMQFAVHAPATPNGKFVAGRCGGSRCIRDPAKQRAAPTNCGPHEHAGGSRQPNVVTGTGWVAEFRV